MTLEEQKKYKRMSEMMKKINQPGIDATAFMGNTLSKAKRSLDDLIVTQSPLRTNEVQSKDYYRNNPNLKPYNLPLGHLLLGNSDRFFKNILDIEKPLPIDEVQSKDYYRNNPTAKTKYLDAIDAATLIPIAGLTAKAGIKGGSWGLSKIFDNKKMMFPDDLLNSKGLIRQQDDIGFFDMLNKPSVFEKQILKRKNINPDAKIYHEHNTLDKVIKNTVPYEKDLNITLKRVTEKVSPNAEVVTRTKLPEKIDLKLGSGKNPENISDVVAGRITVDSVDEIKAVLKELDNNANIIKIDNYYNPMGTKGGYRAVHVQIQNSKGGSAEVIISPKDFIPLNDAGKNYYNAIKYGVHENSFNKLKNILLNKNSKFQKDELFKKLQNNPKNNLINIAPIFPAYRSLLSE